MPYKLLLADDSVTIQRVIELTFADEDVQVTAVGDGQTAIDRISADPPDIVLADVGMPARDGYEVAAFVKNDPALAHIPVLLLTGAFEPVDEARAAAVRCDGVLAKPFEPHLLIGRVKELLAGAPAGSDAPLSTEGGTAPEAPAGLEEEPRLAAEAPGGYTPEDFSLGEGRPGDGRPGDVASADAAGQDLSLDDYFDRLDAAFANLSGAPSGQLKGAVGTRETDLSWAPASTGAWSAADPAGLATGPQVGRAPEAASVVGPAAPAAAEPAPPSIPVADAFAALLAAERDGLAQPVGDREVSVPMIPPGNAVVSDALLNEIVDRLAERLGSDELRDAVVKVVSDIAERLVREEIERVKAAARS